MFTQILRPNVTQWGAWSTQPTGGDDHERVDEDPPSDLDYIYSSNQYSSMRFPALTRDGDPLVPIFRVRGRRHNVSIASKVRVFLMQRDYAGEVLGEFTPGTVSEELEFTTSVVDYDITFPVSPETGVRWTWDDLDAIRLVFRPTLGIPRITQTFFTMYSVKNPIRRDSVITKTLSRSSEITKVVARDSAIAKTLNRDSQVTKVVTAESTIAKTLKRDSEVGG